MKPWCRSCSILQAALFIGFSGCAVYHPAPLDLSEPSHIAPAQPMRAADVARLAVLDDPDLIAARAQQSVAQTELLNAGLLPDPSITGGFAALISGPGSVPAISGGLVEDVSALITYRANTRAARAGLFQVNAQILWQEWQVASQAEQLCITLSGDAQLLVTLQADHAALTQVNNATQAQLAASNLTLAAASASMAALAATDTALNAARQTQAQDRDQLDALLGLEPGIEITLTPSPVRVFSALAARAAIASLPSRRPDLIALRFGYAQADAKLRAAILAQFLPMSLGGTGGRDTSNVWSAGPQVTLTLPLFNRNRGGIAVASATRAQLAAQFRASLANADAGAESLIARIQTLQTESANADTQAASANQIAAQANTAFENGALDALSAVNLQTAASDRAREAILLRTQLLTAQLSLNTLLGAGLPPIASPELDQVP